MHCVGGDPLGAVDGGGVAEPGRGAHVLDGQPGGEPAGGVPDGQVTVRCRRWVMVQRSPFLTQSVAVSRSRRSLLRVMITSPRTRLIAVRQVYRSAHSRLRR